MGRWSVLGCVGAVACAGGKGAGDTGGAGAGGVPAIVDAGRSTHFFDHPFPADSVHHTGAHPDLSGFPAAPGDLGGGVVAGWARRLGETAQGFANNGVVYFRFEGPLAGVPAETAGAADDPVLLIDVDTGERLPLVARFVADPQGDPFYAENTLALAPALGHPPRSGARLAAVVMASAGAAPAAGWSPDATVRGALERAGVRGEVAVATVFTVQDPVAELRALLDDAAPRWAALDHSGLRVRRAARVDFAQGETASGRAGTAVTTTFTDGSTETAWLAPLEGPDGVHGHDLGEAWPMAVYQVEVPILNYSGLDDRPYMSPGLTHVGDVARDSGWIDFVDGRPAREPEVEWIRLTVSLPKGADGAPLTGAPVVIWDHGTGGHAWNAVQRRNGQDDGPELARRFAAAGVAVVGRDAALYGTRYPLIDEGYNASLGFYNIVNLPAFRDNQRQTAIEGTMVRWFVEEHLNGALPEGSVDPTRLLRFGHSMGSVTANLGLAADGAAWDGAFLSGSGGVFTHYFLDTGLLGSFDPALIASLFGLFGAAVPAEVTPAAAFGAALGLPEPAWAAVDRLHPAVSLFQWTMDPSDPMAVARDQAVPSVLFIGEGDLQVPNFTSDALALALPAVTVVRCTPTSADYDPHSCLHREEEGFDALSAWLETALAR
jgi:hypothetical protein